MADDMISTLADLAAYARGLEDAAHCATSFLVGDPQAGVPLRNPMPHEIAARIRTLSPLPPGSRVVERSQKAEDRIAELEAEVARKSAALAAAESWIVDGGYCDARDPCVAESAGFVVAEIRAALAWEEILSDLRALTGGDDRG